MHRSAEFALNSRVVVVLVLLFASVQYRDVIYRVGRRLFGSRNPSTTASGLPGVNTVSAVVRSWLAPSIVMAVFAGLSGHLGPLLDHPLLSGSNFGMSWKPEVPVAPKAKQPPAEPSSDIPVDVNRPKWAVESDTTNGDVRLIVIPSKLWSSEEEASQELLPRVGTIVREDFDSMQKSIWTRTSRGLLSDPQVAQFAIKRRYLERIEQDFGTFTAPMCRLWIQIELSPGVRTEIYPAWNAAVVGNRILMIGAILSWVTLAANAAVLFAHLKAVPNRRLIYAGAVAATSLAAWTAGDLWLVMRLFQ